MKIMKKPILVTGHKNPDTDSICSSIAYAHYKSAIGFEAKPIRLGNINPETKFALDYFEVEKPELVTDVTPVVGDLDYDIFKNLNLGDSLKCALDIFEELRVNAIGIIDTYGRLEGVITLSDLTKKYIKSDAIKGERIPLKNVINVLDAQLVLGDLTELELLGDIHIAAMTPEKMIGYISEGDLLVVGDRTDSQLMAISQGAKYIMVTGGYEPTDEVLEAAKKEGCVIFLSNRSSFDVARSINLCLPVDSVMTPNKKVVKMNIDEPVSLIKDRMLTNRYALFPIVDAQNKLKGFLGRYHLISPKRTQVILVDHNEKSQSVKGLNFTEVIEIIDHHKIGDIQTDNPIKFINDVVGCTATIVANIYFDTKVDLPKNIAGLLLSAIISDTLKFTSPTTTDKDYEIAKKLAVIAQVDLQEYALNLLKAGTSLEGKTPEELFHNDFKVFNISSYKFGVAQLNTLDSESIKNYKAELQSYMKDVCKKENYSALILVMTNILEGSSEIVFEGESSSIIRQAFDISEDKNHKCLQGVVSRKKQIIPKISMLIEK